MSRTSKTEEVYTSRALRLMERLEREEGLLWQDDPVRSCKIIASWRAEWGKSTWRQYKASLVFFMEQFGPKSAVDFLQRCDTGVCRKAARYTSAKKAKQFRAEDLATLLHTLSDRDARWDRLLGLWLVAARATGLRPGEWEHAYIDDEGNLVVKNAKHTNQRGNGETRTLGLHGLPESTRKGLVSFLDLLKQEMDDGLPFENIYTSCRHRLKNIVLQLWPGRTKLPSLYSCRHQLCADLKGARLPLVEIAAVMGHATDQTASEHYGKRAYGESGGKVRAVQADVLQVRNKFKQRVQSRKAELQPKQK